MVVHQGNIIHGINILFMIVWILSIIAYISITIFFVIHLIKKITDMKNQKHVNYLIPLMLIPTTILLQNNPTIYISLQGFLLTLALGFIFIIAPLVLILANIKKTALSRKQSNEH